MKTCPECNQDTIICDFCQEYNNETSLCWIDGFPHHPEDPGCENFHCILLRRTEGVAA